jgi:glutathione S-transferase
MLRIWGRRDSFNLQKVMWCVGELGLAHERIDAAGAYGVTDTAAYLAMNPNGRVPTMDDDGFVLWESNAIARFLAAKHGLGSLCPKDPQARAEADRWMEWQSATVGAVMRPLIITMFRINAQDRDPATVDRQMAEAGRYWAMLDAHLAKSNFVVGESLTMGDIPMGTYAWRWFTMDADRPALVNLERWYARLRDRPAYRDHVMVTMASS